MFIKRRDKEENLYNRLQKQSLEMVQDLSGERWTDFNEHDPGVTFLDVLNYALLELQYSLEFPFEEYLADPETKKLCFEKVGLLPPSEIFAPVTVSLYDYEQLFVKKVDGVIACCMTVDKNALYSLHVEIAPPENEDRVRREILTLYHSHRNLCENLRDITFGKIPEKERRQRTHPDDIRFEGIPESVIFSEMEQIPYRSIQHELPDCYGINERGLPAGADKERQAEALQLKAYLLIYDYLISGVRQQAEGIHALLGLSNQLPPPFRTDVEIEELERLLDTDKQLQTEVFDTYRMKQQKSLFFDRLDMLYGEDTQEFENRPELIRRFPEFNSLRFRSFNLLDETLKDLAGIEHLVDSITYYLVEHILLWNDEREEWATPATRNKLTIVIPRWTDRLYPQEKYLRIFEDRLPAHLHICCLWLGAEDIRAFERHYFRWRKAWATNDEIQIMKYSNKITQIIEN